MAHLYQLTTDYLRPKKDVCFGYSIKPSEISLTMKIFLGFENNYFEIEKISKNVHMFKENIIMTKPT